MIVVSYKQRSRKVIIIINDESLILVLKFLTNLPEKKNHQSLYSMLKWIQVQTLGRYVRRFFFQNNTLIFVFISNVLFFIDSFRITWHFKWINTITSYTNSQLIWFYYFYQRIPMYFQVNHQNSQFVLFLPIQREIQWLMTISRLIQ